LISAESARLAPDLAAGTPTRTLALKGIEHPVLAHVLIGGAEGVRLAGALSIQRPAICDS